MSQIEISVARETLLTLRIVALERECAHLKAHLLQTEAERLRETSARHHDQAMADFLATLPAGMPPPQGEITLDLEAGVVRYAVPETALTVDTS